MATHANSTSASKFDRSAIMREAWRLFHEARRIRESIHGSRPFDRADFGWRLQIAWANARQSLFSPNEQKRAQIEREISRLSYLPLHMNIERRCAALRAELAALAV
ncbi:MAG: hypothetical protein K5872_06535 [Rhizobiaceae bacterium]|nr:hypothetical protein [Rhizobiaceae bacterium]MCV0405870.1 hypothetical protein [Rhizobiaceae bacterium]